MVKWEHEESFSESRLKFIERMCWRRLYRVLDSCIVECMHLLMDIIRINIIITAIMIQSF